MVVDEDVDGVELFIDRNDEALAFLALGSFRDIGSRKLLHDIFSDPIRILGYVRRIHATIGELTERFRGDLAVLELLGNGDDIDRQAVRRVNT